MRWVLGAALLALAQAQSVREKVNFDFSFRHLLGKAPDSASSVGFNDSNWEVVNAPHDMLIVQPYDKGASEKQAFIPRGVGWYRKHFRLPSDWKGDVVWLYIEGSFHETTLWLNGVKLETHVAGYTTFAIRLDNVGGVQYGDSENVLAIYVDASTGTGWWYEGGGLMRHNYLIRAAPEHIATDGAWVYAQNISVADKTANVIVSTTAENFGAGSATLSAAVVILDPAGKQVGRGSSAAVSVGAGESLTLPNIEIALDSVSLWNVQTPYLYTADVSIASGSKVVDSLTVRFGIRGLRFDATDGLFVNGDKVKLRGFCDHSNFGGVGGAVPDRVNLFRAQKLRMVGGNSWRMAHNPPVPARLDFMDRLGMLAIDENRDYGGHKGQGGTTGEDVAQELKDMEALVKRDRSHPSVLIWSFCNEVGCNNDSSAKAFREVSKKWDPTRAVTQNHLGTEESTEYLDVQGLSHKRTSVFEEFHSKYPDKPMMATECCSCMSQRGIDEDSCPNPADGGCKDPPAKLPAGVYYNNNIGKCTADQVIESDALDYITGTFVWSGFDYLGEARGWPQNTKCRGTIADVAGFEKETAYWLKSVWLSNISRSDAGRPLNVEDDSEWTVFILEAWTPPASADLAESPATCSVTLTEQYSTASCKLEKSYGCIDGANEMWAAEGCRGKFTCNGKSNVVCDSEDDHNTTCPCLPTRSVHVYTNAPSVRLELNGKVLSTTSVPYFGMATFTGIPYAAGTLTAVAVAPNGTDVRSYKVSTPGAAGSVVLSLDAPSAVTGTGTAIVADGEDTAMIRATLLDASGGFASQADSNVTFRIVSGKGKIWATHNGDPANLSPSHAPWTPAYKGLARAFVRSTADQSTPAAHRGRMLEIDADPNPTVSVLPPGAPVAVDDIVVEAVVDGIPSARVTIPVTSDLTKSPLHVAEQAFKHA